MKYLYNVMRFLRYITFCVMAKQIGETFADIPFVISGSMQPPWWSEGFWGQVLIFVTVLCLGEWLRTVINGFHENRTGEPHPALRRWLSI